MRRDTYYKIYNMLNKVTNVPTVSRKFGVGEGVLYSILSQKIVRKTKRDFYIIQRQSKKMLEEWRYGKSLLQIAEERKFPPVLTASFILKENGITKREFRDFLLNVDKIKDERLKRDIKEIISEDIVYSPHGIKCQREKGLSCENRMKQWLDIKKIKYMTEEESRAMEREKTPDFLFEKEIKVEGFFANWIESKGSFGSPYQVRGDYHKQLKHYVELFGPGIVSYWMGFVDDIYLGKKVMIVDNTFFDL
ncbi:MAG: TPD domain-containing protein [Candidatus Methanofastidiosia archaeon]